MKRFQHKTTGTIVKLEGYQGKVAAVILPAGNFGTNIPYTSAANRQSKILGNYIVYFISRKVFAEEFEAM